jgi:hypothetical protein
MLAIEPTISAALSMVPTASGTSFALLTMTPVATALALPLGRELLPRGEQYAKAGGLARAD